MKLLTQFYTFNRALEIIKSQGIKALKVLAIKVLKCCVWVKYETKNGVCSLFVSVRSFLKLAIAGRKERAAGYGVEPQAAAPGYYHVYKLDGDMIFDPTYTVKAGRTLECNCADYQEQLEYLQSHPYLWRAVMKAKTVCKHTLRTLNHLGFDRLVDYVTARNEAMKKRVARL